MSHTATTETDAVAHILGRATALLDGIEQIVNPVWSDELVRDRMIASDVERRAAESLVEFHFMPKLRTAITEGRTQDAFEIFSAMPSCATKSLVLRTIRMIQPPRQRKAENGAAA